MSRENEPRAARHRPADGPAVAATTRFRGAYYNSNSNTQRYDVGCTADERQRRVVHLAGGLVPAAGADARSRQTSSGPRRVTNRLLARSRASRWPSRPTGSTTSRRTVRSPSRTATAPPAGGPWRRPRAVRGLPEQGVQHDRHRVVRDRVAHVKGGMNHELGDSRNRLDNRASMSMLTFVNNAAGVPTANSVTVRNTPTTQARHAERGQRHVRRRIAGRRTA